MRSYLTAAAMCACMACASATDVSSTAKTYSGVYSTQVVESTVSTSLTGGGTFPCTNTYTMSGTITMTIDQAAGAVAGSAHVVGTQKETAHSSGSSCVAKGDLTTDWNPRVSGTTSSLRFDDQSVSTNAGYAVTARTSFTGSLSGSVITGTLGFSVAGSGTFGGVTSVAQNYSASTSVTLQ